MGNFESSAGMFSSLDAGRADVEVHLLLFVMRSRSTLFSPPWPAMPLFLAIVGTQVLALLICGFGWFVPAIPWAIIGLVWLYMLVWVIVLDLVKLALYAIVQVRFFLGPLSLAAGTPGGYFTPVLLLGALSGATYGALMGIMLPERSPSTISPSRSTRQGGCR